MVKVGTLSYTEYNPQIKEQPDARVHYIHFEDPSKAIYALVFPMELTDKMVALYNNVDKIRNYLMNGDISFKNVEEFGSYLTTNSLYASNVKDVCKYLMKNGIYYLVEEDEDSKAVKSLYVGKTETGVNRFINHKQKKEWWDKVVVFFSSSDFGPNVGSLERYAIEHGKRTRQVFRNINNSNAEYSDENVTYLKNTYADICSIMDFLGYNLSEKDSARYLFHFKSEKYVKVDMLYTLGGNYVLLPKSEIDFNNHESKKEKERITDRELVNNKGEPIVMAKKNKSENIYQLLIPKFFKNASAPATYAIGKDKNGPNNDGRGITWVNTAGEPLRDVIHE